MSWDNLCRYAFENVWHPITQLNRVARLVDKGRQNGSIGQPDGKLMVFTGVPAQHVLFERLQTLLAFLGAFDNAALNGELDVTYMSIQATVTFAKSLEEKRLAGAVRTFDCNQH